MTETYMALPEVDKFEIACAPNLGSLIFNYKTLTEFISQDSLRKTIT